MKKKDNMLTPLIRYGYYFVIYVVMSYAVTQVVVDGSNRIAKAVDQLFAGDTLLLKTLLTPFIGLIIIGSICAFAQNYAQKMYSVQVQKDMKNMAVAKIVQLPYQYLDEKGTGSILNRLVSDIYRVEELFTETMPQLVVTIVTILTVGVYILQMDYRLLLVTIICYPLLLWIANVVSIKIKSFTSNRMDLYDALDEEALDVFQGMVVGKSFGLEDILRARLDKAITAILKNEYPRTKIGSIAQVLNSLITWIPRIICYSFALYEVLAGQMTVGEMLAFTMLLDRIVHPFSMIPSCLTAFREEWVSVERIQEIMNEPDEPSGTGEFALQDNVPAVALEHVAFSYEQGEGKRPIFTDLNLEIPQGKHIAFVGTSGGGKSTILKILCRFYEMNQGTYLLYGHDIREWNIAAARNMMAYVSQNVFLFPDTIAHNIAYGKLGATKEEIIEACKLANIHDFIESLPDGYDTEVGERGTKLSGGQRQRLSIARAILKEAPILLLDEPTSAVDVDNEMLIQNALDQISTGKTLITIAHRLSTIEHADAIYVFDQGRVAEIGDHQTLLSKQGVYYALYQKETAGEEMSVCQM